MARTARLGLSCLGLLGLGWLRLQILGLAGFRGHNLHLLPVVRKLLAAIETDNVSAGLRTGAPALSPPACDGEAHAFMPASK